jgi:signal transduction histidine kinase
MTTLLQEQPEADTALSEQDLRDLMSAYHAVTERLQHSHEALQHEVVRLRNELANSNAQLQRSKRLAALGEMAAGIAHEIRNPLAAIQLYAGMVVEDLDIASHPSRQIDNASRDQRVGFAMDNTRRIADAVHGLSAIVNDVLTFARPLEPRVAPVHVEHAFVRALDANRPLLAAASVQVNMRVRSPIVMGDADLLHQALVNLVRNAAEAMNDHAGPRELLLGCDEDRETITVSDTGPGVDEQVVDRLFNPFFTTRASGTGLGLAIVHRILDAHGGSVAAHNDPLTGGAVFTLTLPRPVETQLHTHDTIPQPAEQA